MKPIIDHIQITVKDLDFAEIFYDKFLPILGFDPEKKVKAFIKAHDFHVIEYSHPLLAFAITSPRSQFKDETIHRRKPKAETRKEVDKAFEKLKSIGANIVNPPKIYPEYSENYYAVFFKDLQGIKYEIVCTKKE